MNERTLTPVESRGNAPGDDVFADDTPGLAGVSTGIHAEQIPVAGMTVGEIRSRYRDLFNIDPRGPAAIDGRDVDDRAVVRAGQVLIFGTRSGEKGRALVGRGGPRAAANL